MNISDEYRVIKSEINKHAKHVKTNWFVVTGAPSSGKTTSLNLLKKSGYTINHDVSRAHIEGCIRNTGQSAKSIRLEEEQLQKEIFCLMIRNTFSLKTNEVILHDYSLPDNIPFLNLAKLPIPDEIQKSAVLFKFRGVFIFEPLETYFDGVRTETSEEQLILFQSILEFYSSLGYKPIIVPQDSVHNRHLFMMKKLSSITNMQEMIQHH